MNSKYKKILHWVVTVVVLLTAFYVSDIFYFKDNPLFEVLFLAEIIIASILGLFYYFFFIPMVVGVGNFINEWIVKTIRSAVVGVVDEVFDRYSRRVKEDINGEVAKKEEKRQQKQIDSLKYLSNPLVLDTSAIIDGRIVDLLMTGVMESKVVVLSVVIDELKHIADSKDKLRKERGRRGLSLLDKLKKSRVIDYNAVEISNGVVNVDRDIIDYAKSVEGKIATTDFNLQKAAEASDITVINVNILSDVLKTPLLPGDKLTVQIIQKGKGKGQGLSYLDDGTMIVVEESKDKVGETLDIVICRYLQTKAGKMYFAEIVI